jgi:low temperature requirement protein LtrA
MHLLLVAGIILAAVGDELVLAHPTGDSDLKTAAVHLSGSALYLLGNLLFKRATTARRTGLSHLLGLLLLAALAPLALVTQPLTFSTATTAVLVLVAVWETLSLRGSKRDAVAQPARQNMPAD